MLEKRLRELGQDHIARLLSDEADPTTRERIAQDLETFDLELVTRLTRGELLYEPPGGVIEPAEVIPASFAASDEAKQYTAGGIDLLRSGKVAALVVAGGQASRLGIDAPKGAVAVTPVRRKSLFRLFAEKILALERRYACTIPWFIMTSRENDQNTRDYFRRNACFGLVPGNVYFFTQGMLPSVTQEGRFLIGPDGGICMNPDGHGGTFNALRASGSLEAMEDLGIEEIFYFQVDNPLVKVCDPLFLGLHCMTGAQMSSKVVKKADPDEKVGVVARLGNKTVLVEYSDMADDVRLARGTDGELLHWAGSIAIHAIRRDFAEAITEEGASLPFHRAKKMVVALGPDGKPLGIEGVKFETFLFDALPSAAKTVTLEVLREEEFAPVKNRTGIDSLDTSIMLQNALFSSWLKQAGFEVKKGVKVEIGPLFALDREDLASKADSIPRIIDRDTYLG